jgi:hypothetical protein
MCDRLRSMHIILVGAHQTCIAVDGETIQMYFWPVRGSHGINLNINTLIYSLYSLQPKFYHHDIDIRMKI